ncbi:MAG: carbohydrate-binding domain-containing protein [Bacteroidales bacterium]|nr:carbohydrate-binding domain-containing protein [Bacteroidales bacterium]
MRPFLSHILPLSRGIRGGLLLLLLVLLASCSEWDTDSLGTSFTPANSVVRVYNNLVYIEYAAPEARVWGPAAGDVTATISGDHVSIRSEAQNVAYFVYGYPASTDTLGTTDGSLTIESRASYALYLEGLSLRCQDGPVFRSPGNDDCHIVLSRNAVNHLYGPIQVGGNLSLSGVGTLTIESQSTCITAATLQCQYGVKVNINSAQGDGIYLTEGVLRATDGTWNINAGHSAICSTDSILIFGGTWRGTALQGSFLDAKAPVVLQKPDMIAASAWGNNILDSLAVAARYDSVQSVWEEQVDTLTLMADTTYTIRRNSSTASVGRFTPRQTLVGPYVLITNGTVLSSDTLYFSKN